MSDNSFEQDNFPFEPSRPTPLINVEGVDLFDDMPPATVNSEACPILPLRDIAIFPDQCVPVEVGREISLNAVDYCMKNQVAIFCVCQRDPEVEVPKLHDLYTEGVLAHVVRKLELPNGNVTVFVQAVNVAVLRRITSRANSKFLKGMINQLPFDYYRGDQLQAQILIGAVSEAFQKLMATFSEEEIRDTRFSFGQMKPGSPQLLNFVCTTSPISLEMKHQALACLCYEERAEVVLRALNQLVKLLEIRSKIAERTREEISQQQKEHFLQQQIRSIQEELGGDEIEEEQDELRQKAKKMKWSEKMAEHFEKELKRLSRYNPSSPDYPIQYTYLENLLSLPWDTYSPDEFSIDKVEKILDRDHYGLEKVKERIVEQIAVLKLRNDLKAPILCLYGPPGVGKTSLGRSIADALGREYCRVSLGGLHDEAEIRGHRRTYIGAMPGRIINGLTKCGTGNPVFVLDEIDKVGQDFKGDPSMALLEVLDPEQNSKFHDNYLGVDYDLSKVLFIATANSLSTISAPLLDRMELIEIGGYVTAEKYEIAKRHLLPRLIKDHGLEQEDVKFNKAAIVYIIDRYTRESGVRNLEKKISKVLRKLAKLKASGQPLPSLIDPRLVREFLGAEEVDPEEYENNDFYGVVTGLAWTSVGGEILFIESSLSEGKGDKLTLTGNLGDVMKESAILARQYLHANAKRLGIDPELFKTRDIHVHVPAGAIPKDGPSAGITIVTSLASSFMKRRVLDKLAMTGEITLRGKVLPVGGIKEKILAAKRAGIDKIILSSQNRKDIEEIPERYLKGITFHYVDTIDQVLDLALI